MSLISGGFKIFLVALFVVWLVPPPDIELLLVPLIVLLLKVPPLIATIICYAIPIIGLLILGYKPLKLVMSKLR